MDWEDEFLQRDRKICPPALTAEYETRSTLRSPRHPLLSRQNFLVEITGPIFGTNDFGPLYNDLNINSIKRDGAIGQRTIDHGHVLKEIGRDVPKTLGEFWQANAAGRHRHANGNKRPASSKHEQDIGCSQ
jgi:protocatechuate 3,4-dioxygenase beta subunit